jgi:hypothetical protein
MIESYLNIGVVSSATVNNLNNKPCYLITLQSDEKKGVRHFIAIDKYELLNGFIEVKGFYTHHKYDEIISDYEQIITSARKELIINVLFPAHKINELRSLIFKAR